MRSLINLVNEDVPKNAKISASTAPGDVKPEKIGKHVYKRHPSAKARTIKSKLPKTRPIVKSDPQVERDKESFLKSLNEEVKDLLNQIRKL